MYHTLASLLNDPGPKRLPFRRYRGTSMDYALPTGAQLLFDRNQLIEPTGRQKVLLFIARTKATLDHRRPSEFSA
jgi:hypothetical protein